MAIAVRMVLPPLHCPAETNWAGGFFRLEGENANLVSQITAPIERRQGIFRLFISYILV